MALRTLGKIKFSVTESKDTLCPLLYHSPSKSPVRTAQSYPYTMVLKLQETLDYQKQPSYSAGRKRGPRGCPTACPVGSGPRVCRGAQPEPRGLALQQGSGRPRALVNLVLGVKWVEGARETGTWYFPNNMPPLP